jgi:hypothetical protein
MLSIDNIRTVRATMMTSDYLEASHPGVRLPHSAVFVAVPRLLLLLIVLSADEHLLIVSGSQKPR